jgi:zinc protease
VRATTGTRAIVATDPELTRAEVSLLRVAPARPPSSTVADLRRDLVEWIGPWALGRRLDADAAAGRARFEDGAAGLDQWARAIRMATVRASGPPAAWRDMLGDLGDAVQRARLHGFTPREIDAARRALLADAREAVARDATAPVRSVLAAINRAVTTGEPILAPAQRLALLEQLLPGISAAEVSVAFAAAFDPADVVAIAKLPASAGAPAETELARDARSAVDVRPAAAPERAVPTALLPVLPDPGAVVEETVDAPTAVTSFWLDNGVRGHHRLMEQRKGEVIVTVTLAGGAIEETATTRGVTEAALQAWAQPATSRLTSTDVRDLLVGKRVRVESDAGEDTLTLTVRTTPEDLETAVQLVHLLLTDPAVEPVALERWREASRRRIARRDLEPLQAMQHAAAEALAPSSEPRMRPLGRDEVSAVTRDAAQAWLRRLVATAPLEAAIVGDVARAEAVRLAARYLGALPPRSRIDDGTLASLRRVQPPAGPIRVARLLATRTPQAAVAAGFRGADASNRAESRLLAVAARVLSSRMYRTLRQERQLVYSIGAASRPGVAYPGFGLFVAQAPTDPSRAEALAREIEAMYEHFAIEGPTEAEIAVARRQIVAQIDELLERPEFWAERLAANDYRGRTPREAIEARAHYERITATEVHDAFRRYDKPASRFSIRVGPDTRTVPTRTVPAAPVESGPRQPGA